MFRLQGLLLFFALLVGVFGAATPSFKCEAAPAHVKKINHAFAFPKQMCRWYNSASRHVSPLTSLSATEFTAACACINKKHPKANVYTHPPPAGFAPKCDVAVAKRLRHIAKAQPVQFCKFWGPGLANFRVVSPFAAEGITNIDIYNGCSCIKAAAASAAASKASETATETATATGTGSLTTGTLPAETTGSATAEPTGSMTGSMTAEPTASVTGSGEATPSATGESTPSATPSGGESTPSATPSGAEITPSATHSGAEVTPSSTESSVSSTTSSS